jgi:hypothetical protein
MTQTRTMTHFHDSMAAEEMRAITALGVHAGHGYLLGRPNIQPADWQPVSRRPDQPPSPTVEGHRDVLGAFNEARRRADRLQTTQQIGSGRAASGAGSRQTGLLL